MSARFQLRIQRYGWDRAASCYEDLWGRQVAPAREALLEMADLRPGHRVLDAACGPGPITFAAAARTGPDGCVLGVDISEEMVESARARVGAEGVEHVTFLRRDLETALPEASDFDVALCSLGLMYAPDPGRALEIMRGVLRPGGRVVAAVWGERSRCGWAEIFPIVNRRVKSAVCPLFFQLGTGDALGLELGRAGFSNVQRRRVSTTLEYASADEAVGAAFAGGPVALAYSRFAPEMRRLAEDEYLESLEPYRSGDGYRVPGEFLIVSGAVPRAAV